MRRQQDGCSLQYHCNSSATVERYALQGGSSSWPCLPSVYYAEDLIKTMTGLLSGCLCLSGLACGTRRVHRNVEMGENICKREFRNWMAEILWAICCYYQTCIHLLASGISVQLFNTRGWKGCEELACKPQLLG